MGVGTFQSFYLGGGVNPASVSGETVKKMFTRQHEGPIVNLDQVCGASSFS
ncbi:hypothetical protein PIB30_046347 [Stylosanthes scabra]|uniref:Uncharacterized protein n=1 Tax=Stylosanthes scabra TaxID=79078 RepID=A0ABU6WEQ6_9FABA|nr:hypothetical protein [Stylosanthes scabra]